MADLKYILDANVFIHTSRVSYPLDVCPGYWRALDELCSEGIACSLDIIKKEIEAGDDDLAEWIAETDRRPYFRGTDADDLFLAYQRVIQTVEENQQYKSSAKAEFANVPDSWLIAYAHLHNLTVVTMEQPAPQSKSKVKIPDVCIQLSIPWCNVLDMLRSCKKKIS